MARKLGIQHPGAIYHVMNWADREEAIFGHDEDRQRLLQPRGQSRLSAPPTHARWEYDNLINSTIIRACTSGD